MAIDSTTPRTRSRVLFVGHDGSPQIAASLLQNIAGDRVIVATAAIHPADPGGRWDEMLVSMGLDLAQEKRLSAKALYTADRVISLGTGFDVAQLSGALYEEWDLEQNDLDRMVDSLSDDLIMNPAGRDQPKILARLQKRLKTFIRH